MEIISKRGTVLYENKTLARYRELVEEAIGNGVDLTDADMSYQDLSFANLAGAKLVGANLTGADLESAVLDGAKLNGACFQKAFMKNAQASEATLIWCDLTQANLNK